MARGNMTARYRLVVGYFAAMNNGDVWATTAPCPLCAEAMTYTPLSSVEVAGCDLSHDLPRNGDVQAPWTWDACYPACSDCNGEDSNTPQERERVVIVAEALRVLSSDYRVSGPQAEAVIERNRAVTEGRKARKRATREAAGTR